MCIVIYIIDNSQNENIYHIMTTRTVIYLSMQDDELREMCYILQTIVKTKSWHSSIIHIIVYVIIFQYG